MKVLFNCKLSQLMGGGTVKSLTCKFVFLLVALLILRALLVPPSPGFGGVEWSNFVYRQMSVSEVLYKLKMGLGQNLCGTCEKLAFQLLP